jgi:hypothetical protein
MRKVPKRLRKNVAWILRNEYVVLAGWCSRYRPTAGPGDFAVGLNGTFEEIWIHPAGAGDDEDQYIGPYSWEAARELAVQGRSVLALGMMANER